MKNLFLINILVYSYSVFGQLNVGGIPYSITNPSFQSGILNHQTKPLNMMIVNAQDYQDSLQDQPPRFGYSNSVSLNITNSGIWKTLPTGEKLWQIKIFCPSAKSINFVFSQFHLPEGGILYIYNPTNNKTLGGFTSKNNRGTFNSPKRFTTGLTYGDQVIVELKVPPGMESKTKLQFEKIIHGYRYILYTPNPLKNYGGSSSCNVNINCREGASYNDQKNGVAMIIIDGNRRCTGSMVNNGAQNQEPYFLTASHCLSFSNKDVISDPNLNDWLFVWQYEVESCNNSPNEPPVYSTLGATIVSNSNYNFDNSDFALLKLSENPMDIMPPLKIFFNGWDRTNNPIGGGAGIHHPLGDVKKISTFLTSPILGTYYPKPGTHWKIVWNQTSSGWGITEFYSSGSPLFMNNGRIIGQLHGGPSACGQTPENKYDEYGRFDVSWNNSTDYRRRLKEWLDPNNINMPYLDGIYGTRCSITDIKNKILDYFPIYQDCSIEMNNTTINSGKTILKVGKAAEFFNEFEVKENAEFEVLNFK